MFCGLASAYDEMVRSISPHSRRFSGGPFDHVVNCMTPRTRLTVGMSRQAANKRINRLQFGGIGIYNPQCPYQILTWSPKHQVKKQTQTSIIMTAIQFRPQSHFGFPRPSAPKFTARAGRTLPTAALVTTAAGKCTHYLQVNNTDQWLSHLLLYLHSTTTTIQVNCDST